MIEVVTDEKWKKPIGDYVKAKAHFAANYNDDFSFIGFVEDNNILAGVVFTDYDGYNIWIHLVIEHPRVITKNRIGLAMNYCFKQLNCGRITAMCRNEYKRNERLLKAVGFIKEGIVRKSMKINNIYYDGALYGMLKNECKWIKGDKN